MNFTDAMGDKNHREFRRVGGDTVFFWLGTGEERELKQRGEDGVTREPRFTWLDYFRTEFEFVAEEVIEVGDEVQHCKLHVCELLYTTVPMEEPFGIKEGIFVNGSCSCREPLDKFKLIRKGPKVQTFEGATDIDFNCKGSQVFKDGPLTITFTEEVSK